MYTWVADLLLLSKLSPLLYLTDKRTILDSLDVVASITGSIPAVGIILLGSPRLQVDEVPGCYINLAMVMAGN